MMYKILETSFQIGNISNVFINQNNGHLIFYQGLILPYYSKGYSCVALNDENLSLLACLGKTDVPFIWSVVQYKKQVPSLYRYNKDSRLTSLKTRGSHFKSPSFHVKIVTVDQRTNLFA